MRVNTIGAMSLKNVISVKPLAQSLDGVRFKDFLREELIPKLWSGAVLVMDNRYARAKLYKAHKVAGVQEMLAAVGVKVVYLPPYSPECYARCQTI